MYVVTATQFDRDQDVEPIAWGPYDSYDEAYQAMLRLRNEYDALWFDVMQLKSPY